MKSKRAGATFSGVTVPCTHPSQFLNPQGTGMERWPKTAGGPKIKHSGSNNLCKIAEGTFWLWKELPCNIYLYQSQTSKRS